MERDSSVAAMPKMPDAEQWISFRIGSEMYAQPIASVKEVIPYKAPVPVPGSPQPVDGILNVRGEVIPIFSGQQLLNPPTTPQQTEKRIIILEHREGQMGISVDAVAEILNVPRECIEHGNPQEDSPVIGTTRQGDRLLILIDLATCCQAAADGP